MTTHPTRSRRPDTERAAGHYISRDIVVIGNPHRLDQVINNHRRKGTLVGVTDFTQLPSGNNQVTLRLREQQPARVKTARRTRIAVIVAAITGTVAGLVAVAAYLIGQLVELIAAHAGLILSVLALAAILAALAARGSGRRRHCPGC